MRLVPLAILSILIPCSALARLGESEAQSVERYGAPFSAKRLSSGANGSLEKTFFKNDWQITSTFVQANDGTLKIVKEVSSHTDKRPITSADLSQWAEHERPGMKWKIAQQDRQWTAADGTIAAVNDDLRSLRFEMPLSLINEGEAPTSNGPSAAKKKQPDFVSALVGLGIIIGIANVVNSQRKKSRGRRKAVRPSEPVTASPLHVKPQHTGQKGTLAGVTWEELELLTGELYRRKGFEVELSAGTGSDGGIDLVLHQEGAKTLVQCKHYSSQKVPVNAIREFYGTLTHEGVGQGVFVTTGEFSRDARDFAAGKPIELIDGSILALMVENGKTSPEEDLINVAQWASSFFAQARLTTPDCPYCKVTMVLRPTAKPFWGCRTYPNCNGKRELRQHATAMTMATA